MKSVQMMVVATLEENTKSDSPRVATVNGRQEGRDVYRQTISLPPEDYALFLSIVARLEKAGLYSVPLSAVARAAIRLLADLSDKNLVAAVKATPVVKTGRKPVLVENKG